MADSAPIKVVVVGATGRTGESVVNGLLASETKFEITTFTRESSLQSETNQSFRSRGVKTVGVDLKGPKESLVKLLTGVDVIVSTITFTHFGDQIPLAEAAKEAGVKRFVPCFWGTSAPKGVMKIHDEKLEILDAIQRLHVPYTVIDVGWWSQQVIQKVPSGRTNHAVLDVFEGIPGDGTVRFAITDCRDIGKYTAKIIADPRTLNRSVLAYTEVITYNDATDLLEEVSGEKIQRVYRPAEELRKRIARSSETLKTDPTNYPALFELIISQYFNSWAVRGDSNPETATYLGYLDSKELYPGVQGKTLREIYTEVLDGKPSGMQIPDGFKILELAPVDN